MKATPEANTFELIITNAVPGREDGTYKVTSPNTDCECKVVVEEIPLKFVRDLENCKLKLLPTSFYEALKVVGDAAIPELLKAFTDQYPRTAKFECQLSKPFKDVVWSLNNREINFESEKIQTIRSNSI